MIEDDLAASPVRLRAEIRRLRASATGIPDLDAEIEQRVQLKLTALINGILSCKHDQAVDALACAAQKFLCPWQASGCACACIGACKTNAAEVLQNLHENGYRIITIPAVLRGTCFVE